MPPLAELPKEQRQLAERLQAALGAGFAVEGVLGSGGFAVVFRVRDLGLKRELAVKVLNPDMITSSTVRERFQREAETIAQLSHPNIVPLHFVGRHEDLLYLAMPCVQGGTLADRLKESGPLPIASAVRVLTEVASALGYAHQRGIVHRDVKPQNVLLDADSGHCLVSDFGIARTQDSAALTSSGLIVGTAAYLSPEQLNGERGDSRVDLYALGVLGYEILTGKLPVEGPSPAAIMMRRMTGKPPSPSAVRAEVPAALDRAIVKCLAPEAGDRFQTSGELLAALDSGLSGATSMVMPWGRSRRVTRWTRIAIGAGAAVLVLGLGTARLIRSRQVQAELPASSGGARADLVVIAAGEYQIGSGTDPGRARPAHFVRLDSFAIARREATVRDYAAFARGSGAAVPWTSPPADSSLPVTMVSWADADRFCAWRYREAQGGGGRLPTEEEWEAAARGASGRIAPWPAGGAGVRANLASAGRGSAAPVGSYPLGDSPEGVSDLLGNVWEWTSSPMAAYPGGPAMADSLRNYRVIRGGAFDTADREATPWLRGYSRPAGTAAELAHTGIRCARSLAGGR